MSDSAFPTGRFPGYTVAELEAAIAAGRGGADMLVEIERRNRAAAGDISMMTPSERLRFIRKGV